MQNHQPNLCIKYAIDHQISSGSLPAESSEKSNEHHNNGLNFRSQCMESQAGCPRFRGKTGSPKGDYALLHRAYAILHHNKGPIQSAEKSFRGPFDSQAAEGADPGACAGAVKPHENGRNLKAAIFRHNSCLWNLVRFTNPSVGVYAAMEAHRQPQPGLRVAIQKHQNT